MTRRVGVVTRDLFRTYEMKALHRAAVRCGMELVPLDPLRTSVDLLSGRILGAQGVDAAIGRVDAGCLEPGARLLELLEKTAPVLNGARAFRTGRDKRRMTHALARAGVPHPPTWLVAPADVPRLLRTLPFPLVAKPAVGANGRGVVRLARPGELVDFAKGRKEPLYLQAFCEGIREEFRILCLDGKLLGAVRRLARRGEWRANLALGGRVQKACVGGDVERAALSAAAAVGADFAGVDVAVGPGGPMVLEVNVCAGFRGFAQATGVDAASRLIEAVVRRIQGEGVPCESDRPDRRKALVQGP